MPSRPKHW